MLFAETIIAKVVAFICQKAAARIGSLAFDKRKRACRSLTKLYYCVQALEEVTEAMLEDVNVDLQLSNKTEIEGSMVMYAMSRTMQ